MAKIVKALVIISVLIFLLFLLFPNSTANSKLMELSISKFKESYAIDENIVVGGRAPKNTDIILFFDDQISLSESDRYGHWSANLGKASQGQYSFQVLARISPNKDLFKSMEITVSHNKKFSNKIIDYFKAELLNIFN